MPEPETTILDQTPAEKPEAEAETKETETAETSETTESAEKPEAETKEAETAEDSKAPEPVDYSKLKFPEGQQVDEALLKEFSEVAQSMNDGKGITADDAQKVVDLRNKLIDAQTKEWETRFSEWRGEITSDSELGGENLQKQTIPNVMKAAEKYGSKELVELLRTNRLYGENPELIRFFDKVGRTLREDEHSRGKAASDADEQARLKRMYPTHFKD